ncbi:MAG: phytase [Pseudomonadota bacterium]
MLRPFYGFAFATLAIAAACASIASDSTTARVFASAETVPVGTVNADAADDPAIWRNAKDPAKSLIVGTDKRAGLYVYNLKGDQLFFLPATGLNNVDLVELSDGRVLVAASDRSDRETAHIFLASLDTANGTLSPGERIAVGSGEGYGICMDLPEKDGTVRVFSAPKNGAIYQTVLQNLAGDLKGTTTRLTRVPSQPEGCVADPRTGTLYIGEEAAGVWAIDIATGAKELVAPTGTGMTVADVEGLALAPEGKDGGYLVASSQGDNAFAVYRLPGVEPVGRFRIALGAFGSVEETDGIELDPRPFGPDFPAGLFVAQDGVNPPKAQNFKLVRWDTALAALKNSDDGEN